MKHLLSKLIFFLAPLTALASIATIAVAVEPGGYKVVDGTAIYFAVVPAEIIRGHAKQHTEATMHGGIPGGAHVHHIMVALFDANSFERIVDAKVKATVTEIGLAGETKTLEPFTIAEALTYGNYFKMSNNTTYRVDVVIDQTGTREDIETVFEYKHR